MTYEEAKQLALSMPEVASRGPQYVEDFIQGFMEAMNDESELMDAAGIPDGEA